LEIIINQKDMEKYRVVCRIEGSQTTMNIECRELTVVNGAYCFWKGEYGKTNKLMYAFPVMFTIVENLQTEEEI